MKKKEVKKEVKVDKIYMVVSEESNDYFTEFSKAEAFAKDQCEKLSEEIEIYEITKSWHVYYPEEPEPEVIESSLDELMQ